MKKQLLFILTTILSFNCYSQISFEKGYYIDNNNQKITCLIKNEDWRNNPTEVEYKLNESSEPKTATVKSIKEFGIENVLKFVSRTVNIDRSSETIKYLNKDIDPIFQEEVLFLKVLVDGEATLYQYFDKDLRRYFYDKDNSNIKQLIWKKYKFSRDYVGTNNKFRQQLWLDLKCPNFELVKIRKLEYKKKDLVRFFTKYNECHKNDYINYESIQKKDLFNLTIRPRINSSSLTIQNPAYNDNNEIVFEKITGFGLGLEAELILPFNKNKWAIVIEPTYRSYKSENTINANNIIGGELLVNVEYNSIETPIGLRHYFYINNNSKVFVNASFIIDASFNSSVEFTKNDDSNFESLDIKTGSNQAIGIGYKQNDKYSLEIRYQTKRQILGSYSYWGSKFKTLSIIFGYSLF